eukprot:CAMPEP_0117674080 /NCGR_PEP_ID=MMETSP0804-20121206/14835_1 /TAXON_ID=1074897 /ORGANISM="Tetraselmis astigmatica, Strain CCMP880" /LENGTH=257 /DNA_ID=CAMNT_0005482901 /DNA_START=391 /DNA_END=1160 /DNA_ORIENTATION=-
MTTHEGASGAGKGKMPTLFISHGGGPMPLMDDPGHKDMIKHLKGLPGTLPEEPKAVLVVSAHWEAEEVAVQASPKPSMLFDYYNFPPETYKYSYPAPGAPSLARRTVELLQAAGIPAREDTDRGFDHGTFVPLMLMYPKANIPVFQVSLSSAMDPEQHIQIGVALASLREEGVLILGSGMTYHNFAFEPAVARIFDEYLSEAVVGTSEETRRHKLTSWSRAPGARKAHPREEHLMPLMVVAGAAGSELGERIFNTPL